MKTRFMAGPLRAAAIISMLAVLVSGVTFAALRSQNNFVSGNRLTSASANLTIGKHANGLFSNSISGYSFTDLKPGGPAAPLTGNDIYFKNVGSTILDLKVSVNPSRLVNAYGADLHKAYLVVMDNDGATQIAKYSLADLIDSHYTGMPLALNLHLDSTPIHLLLRMQLDDLPSTTDQIEISDIDFIFTGTAV
jgi:hypothetical protein